MEIVHIDQRRHPRVRAGGSLIYELRKARLVLEALAERVSPEKPFVRSDGSTARVASGSFDNPGPDAVAAPVLLRCLGRLRLEVNGAPLSLDLSGKPASLLKFLVTRGRGATPRDQVIEALWPDCEAEAAVRRLRVALHELREVLKPRIDPDVVLAYRHGCLSLASSSCLELDASVFESHWRRGVGLEREDRLPEALIAFRAADSLYAGDFLEEDPYEEWTLMRRESLRDAHLDILGKLAVASLREGCYSECIAFCQRLLQEDPCREDVYALVIRCHLATGQPRRARRWLELCRQALHRELDREPAPETLALLGRTPE